MLSDAFIALEDEIQAYVSSAPVGPAMYFPTVQGKNIGPLALLALEALLQQTTMPELDRLIERLRVEDEAYGEAIYQFPDTVVTILAHLPAVAIEHYGALWASTDELQGRAARPSVDALTRYLYELHRLALRAQTERKHMYMWFSL